MQEAAKEVAPSVAARARQSPAFIIAGPEAVPIQTTIVQRRSSCACGGGCPRCQPVQAKLAVGRADDAYEREADSVADRVMRMAEPTVQREPD